MDCACQQNSSQKTQNPNTAKLMTDPTARVEAFKQYFNSKGINKIDDPRYNTSTGAKNAYASGGLIKRAGITVNIMSAGNIKDMERYVIARFQRMEGLPPTCIMDARTAARLAKYYDANASVAANAETQTGSSASLSQPIPPSQPPVQLWSPQIQNTPAARATVAGAESEKQPTGKSEAPAIPAPLAGGKQNLQPNISSISVIPPIDSDKVKLLPDNPYYADLSVSALPLKPNTAPSDFQCYISALPLKPNTAPSDFQGYEGEPKTIPLVDSPIDSSVIRQETPALSLPPRLALPIAPSHTATPIDTASPAPVSTPNTPSGSPAQSPQSGPKTSTATDIATDISKSVESFFGSDSSVYRAIGSAISYDIPFRELSKSYQDMYNDDLKDVLKSNLSSSAYDALKTYVDHDSNPLTAPEKAAMAKQCIETGDFDLTKEILLSVKDSERVQFSETLNNSIQPNDIMKTYQEQRQLSNAECLATYMFPASNDLSVIKSLIDGNKPGYVANTIFRATDGIWTNEKEIYDAVAWAKQQDVKVQDVRNSYENAYKGSIDAQLSGDLSDYDYRMISDYFGERE